MSKKDVLRSYKNRTSFKNVETQIHSSPIPDETLRPRINSVDEIKKLAEDLRSSPTAVVNFLVDTGLEVLTRSKEEIKQEMIKKLRRLLK